MTDVVVRPVRSWLDRRRFINLPWKLYRDDPCWIPPLRANIKALLGYTSHPFHETSDVATFLAWRNGEPVGRIAAIENREHNRLANERRGFFGFFESVNDPQVAAALFDAARQWHAERGTHTLRGPVNPSMNYECGLLIEGFGMPPTFMMTYNPAYYVELLEGYGFRKAHDLLAYRGYTSQLPEVMARLDPLADQAQAFCNAVIRTINPRRFVQDVEKFMELYNSSLVVNWGFVPLVGREITKLAGDMRHLLVPELSIFADVDGQCAGAIFGLPDYNPRIKEINGRLFPLGIFRLLSKKRDIKRVRVLSINVLPEYQRWGLGLVLMRAMVPKVVELGIVEAEFSWVSEDNSLARMGLEKGGAHIYKRYRIYDLAEETAAPAG